MKPFMSTSEVLTMTCNTELLVSWTLSVDRFSQQVRGKTPTLLGPLEGANLNHGTEELIGELDR
jgi:hypothetical protein